MQNDWIAQAVQASGRAHFGSDFGGFFHSIGHAFSSAAKGVSKGVNSVGHQLSKVPVVGSGLHAVYDIAISGPIAIGAGVASGQRVDHVAMANLKSTIKDTKDIAPYVTTVVSLVPGVGQGVSGVIGAASALASGKPIGEALLSGVKGALPGGAIAGAAFDVAVAGAQGKPISDIALASLPLNPDQKKVLVTSVHAARDIAHGKRVDEAVFAQGKALLPADAQKALTVGLAVAHAKNLQDMATKGAAAALPALNTVGSVKIQSDPVLNAGFRQLKSQDEGRGFIAGIGTMAHVVNRTELNTIRGRLKPAEKKGFDLALSAHIGQLTHPLPPTVPAAERFGYYVHHGMQSAKPDNQRSMRTVLVSHPEMTKGIVNARTETELGFLAKLKAWILKNRKAAHT